MNMQRITISLPSDVHTLLTQHVGSGNVSRFITQTIHSRLVEEKITKTLQKDPVRSFLALRERVGKLPTKAILTAIHRGRRGY